MLCLQEPALLRLCTARSRAAGSRPTVRGVTTRCGVRVAVGWYTVVMNADYQAYLLRLHRRKESSMWRATLENAHTGEILQFGSHMDLLLHLFEMLRDDSGRPQHSKQSLFSHTDSK